MENTINGRIEQLIKKLNNGKQKDFAVNVGIGVSTLNNIVSGRKSEPSFEVLNRILTKFSNVNSDWLITGKGEMLSISNSMNIPYYDIDATASNLNIYNDGHEFVTSYIEIVGFKDCDFACNVSGNSMAPMLLSGDIILCKKIKDMDWFNYGETYLIITNEQRLIKKIKKSDNGEQFIKLESENPDFDSFDIPISKILNLFIVKGRIERKII